MRVIHTVLRSGDAEEVEKHAYRFESNQFRQKERKSALLFMRLQSRLSVMMLLRLHMKKCCYQALSSDEWSQ